MKVLRQKLKSCEFRDGNKHFGHVSGEPSRPSIERERTFRWFILGRVLLRVLFEMCTILGKITVKIRTMGYS
jgi:hypothetical protein